MNGDITRDTFDAEHGYTAVRAQQGRVMLDADQNESVDIQRHDVRGGRSDMVGRAGAPADEPGFGISLVGGVPTLSAGRFLLDGARLRNSAALPLSGPQPFLAGATLPSSDGEWLVYLEAWDEAVSAVEVPNMREVALGGPDTTFRERQVWQVRWLRLGNTGAGTTCAAAEAALDAFGAQFDGTLQPELDASTITGPCIVSEAAEFRGAEHQAFRIEIHTGNIGIDGTALGEPARFKWSRDNNAVIGSAVGLVSASPIVLTVNRLGPGGAEGFDRGVMIEVSSERQRLSGQPGVLARVDDVAGDALTLTLLDSAAVGDLQTVLGQSGVVVRRWDSVDLADVDPAGTAVIEDGLQVNFSSGNYRTGDYWLLPMRTAIVPGRGTQIDWPSTGGVHEARPSQAPPRHRVPLAILEQAGSAWTLLHDCRVLFPPLGSILALAPHGGDGQHGAAGEWLPAPITVRAVRGRVPAANLTLRFVVAGGGGLLAASDPSTSPATAATLDVVTDADGLAQVFWQLGASPGPRDAGSVWEPTTSQSVAVSTLGPEGQPGEPSLGITAQLLDHRNLSIVGGNAQHGRPGERLEVALRARIDEGARPVAGGVVEFAILNLVFEGQALDQGTGGTLLASANFVSGDLWTGGTAHRTVRTTTDAEGVAQVQWTLGTRLGLTTQRVEARLLDADGNPGAQRAIYTAQLAIADQTAWQPNVAWLAGAVGAANRHVQAAIDAIAGRVDALSVGTPAFEPFVDLQWRSTANAQAPLQPQTVVGVQTLAALSFRPDLVPAGRDLSRSYSHGGVVVTVELPDPRAGLMQVVRLAGNVRRSTANQRWEWTLDSSARASLDSLVGPEDDGMLLVARISVVPRWLPGGEETDSALAFESAFRILVGQIDLDEFIVNGVLRDTVVAESNILRGGLIRNGRITGGFLRRR